jgi:hypothetical protein
MAKQPLNLELTVDDTVAPGDALPALVNLLLAAVERDKRPVVRTYRELRDYCIRWAAARGLPLPPP